MNIEIKLTKVKNTIRLIAIVVIFSFMGDENKNRFNEGVFALSFSYKLQPDVYSIKQTTNNKTLTPM